MDVANALRDLRSGGSPMNPIIARKVLQRLRKGDATPVASGVRPEAPALTERESATLDLIARGYTYEETARLLSVSIATVRTHIRGIYGKLAVNSRGEAVFEAHKLGLLQNGSLKT